MRDSNKAKISSHKLTLILAFLFYGISEGKCQRAIEINYDRTVLNNPDGTKYEGFQSVYIPRIIFNDSFSLMYFYNETSSHHYKGKQVGNKLMHHGIFTNFITGEKFAEVNWSKKEKYLLDDSIRSWNWQYLKDEVKILNKTCNTALSINSNNDSILVFYTTDIEFKKAMFWYDGLPGVPLEIFDQRRNMHFKAIEIRETDIRIVPPQEGIKVSRPEWTRIAEARRVKLGR